MGLPIGLGDAEHWVLAWPAAVGWSNGVICVLGLAPPRGMSQCQSPPLQGHLRVLVAKGAGGHGASVCSSVESLRKQAKSLGNGGLLLRSSVRTKQTCFFVRPWGEHSVTDPGREWRHLVVCIRVLSGHILLTSLLLDSHCWGCRWSLLKEWCNHSSLWNGYSSAMGMDSAVALCCYGLCYGAVSSSTITPCLLGNLLPSALCWEWSTTGWIVSLWVPSLPRQRLGCFCCTPEPNPHQALA